MGFLRPAKQAAGCGPLSACGGRLDHLRLFIRHFAPSWMVITMGTGSVAVTIRLFPFHFPGQDGIALAVWCLDLVLLTLFLLLLVSRFVLYPGSIRELLEQPNQSLFLGTLPMSISSLTAGIVNIIVPRCGGPAVRAAYVLAWANLPIVAVVALLVPMYMFSVQDHNIDAMTAIWLVPVIPGTTAAAVTGAVSKGMVTDAESVLLLYLSLCMLAVGFALSYHVLSIYYQRLICHNLPPREVIVSSFIPVGAVGMAGWALLNAANAAERHLRAYYEALPSHVHKNEAWLDAVIPACMAGAGVLGLCLWAYAGWWLLLAIASVGQTMRQSIPFNLGWWGSVFPIGTFAGTTLALSNQFDSHALRVMGAAVACCQVAVWLFVAGMTIVRGLAGDLFHPPCLAPPSEGQLSPAASRLEVQLSRAVSAAPGSEPTGSLRRSLVYTSQVAPSSTNSRTPFFAASQSAGPRDRLADMSLVSNSRSSMNGGRNRGSVSDASSVTSDRDSMRRARPPPLPTAMEDAAAAEEELAGPPAQEGPGGAAGR